MISIEYAPHETLSRYPMAKDFIETGRCPDLPRLPQVL